MKHPASSVWANWPVVGPLSMLWKQSSFDSELLREMIAGFVEDYDFKRAFSV